MESVWQNACDLPQFPRLRQDVQTEVLIVGGGLAGILCAYELHRAGVPYLLIEADRICGGVSGRTTAKITAQHGLIYAKLLRRFGAKKARQYYEANEAALAQYRTLCQTIDCDFTEADAYIYSLDRPKKLQKELLALQTLGAAAELVPAPDLPFPTAGAIRFPKQAQFHPLKFVRTIAEGLHIYEHTPLRSFDGVRYQTDSGTITAQKAVIATHFPMFNKHGAYFLKLYQHRSYVLALENAAPVDGMYMDERKDGVSLRNYGKLLLLGGGVHRTGKSGGGWAALEAFARKYYPNAQISYRWAAQDCMTPDDMPYIGQYSPHTPNLFVATGFNKWGMTSSMVAAQLLCDLVQGRENSYEALFSPRRSILRPQVAGNALHAVGNLLTPTVPRCPHMGCALKWNRQEHTWDCPCHGSRFTREGKLLNNPATGDLKNKPPA